MTNADTITSIESEWEIDTGFLWKARQGLFDPVAFERTYQKLQNLVFDEATDVPRRLVSLLWYMPLFLTWQTDRVREVGGDVQSYTRAITSITNEIERLLGTP
jgi:hypothetical protein